MCSFKVSGKPNLKKPIILLGNIVIVDFTSSSQVKDEHSLNRWGFKLTAKPIYGTKLGYSFGISEQPGLSGSDLLEENEKFGNEENLCAWVDAIKILTLCSKEMISSFQNAVDCDSLESSYSTNNVLKWDLLKKGLAGSKVQDFVIKPLENGSSWGLANEFYPLSGLPPHSESLLESSSPQKAEEIKIPLSKRLFDEEI
jgi:other hect domain ubiquitin protein ligase E3